MKKNKSNLETRRINLIKEIGDISHIPEIQEYFTEALKKAKKKFQDKISDPRYQRKNSEEGETK
ncbi:MAG: hypothetical protein GTN82_12840 [Candidatus Aminicenantes bacterium]|nr:hypothetical protein [Candidatus Aminicenantes bacterium]